MKAPFNLKQRNVREQDRWRDASLRMVLMTAMSCAAVTSCPAPASSHVLADAAAPKGITIPIKEVDFAKIPRLLPTASGIDQNSQRRLLKERERGGPTFRLRQPGPDGKPETAEMQYRRLYPYPNIEYDRGGPDIFGVGSPQGAVSVSGIRLRFAPDGGHSEGKELLWRWDVPAALRNARMSTPRDQSERSDTRFQPVLIADDKARRLLLFDAVTGLLWDKDIWDILTLAVGQVSKTGISREKEAKPNPFSIVGFGCSSDDASTLIVLSPYKATADVGVRLLVFDRVGNLISQTELAGIQAFGLRRNGSGSSYLLSVHVFFEEGKPFTNKPPSVDLFLRSDGTVAGLFSKEDGSLVADRVDVADDDVIAVASSGLVFTLP